MKVKKKKRLDVLLVEKGLAATKDKAQALILAGQASVDGDVCTQAFALFDDNVSISLIIKNKYVSRGGLKLESALNSLNILVEGKVCLDVGASTGGFTDCLLTRGAKKVYALDVGEKLLDCKLCSDPRVVNIENTNFRHFNPITLKDTVEFITIDASFISLCLLLPIANKCLNKNGEILAMVKPQFESLPSQMQKGVVRKDSVRQEAIEKIKNCAQGLGLSVLGGVDSAIKGPKGNLEHFLWLKKG